VLEERMSEGEVACSKLVSCKRELR
jgi:hypothetical protein